MESWFRRPSFDRSKVFLARIQCDAARVSLFGTQLFFAGKVSKRTKPRPRNKAFIKIFLPSAKKSAPPRRPSRAARGDLRQTGPARGSFNCHFSKNQLFQLLPTIAAAMGIPSSPYAVTVIISFFGITVPFTFSPSTFRT